MKKIISIALAVVMLFAMGTTAFAAGGVTYLDKTYENGKVSTVVCSVSQYDRISPKDEVWGAEGAESWYVLDDDVTLSGRPVVTGNVNLILTDGKTLTAGSGITLERGNSLTVFAQSDDAETMGQLVVTVTNGDAGIGGRGGADGTHEEKSGEKGKSAGVFCQKGGKITVNASGSTCIGGGNGGNGRVAEYDTEAGSSGGWAGSGDAVEFYGGITALTGAVGIGGGRGGDAGYNCYGTPGFGGQGGNWCEVTVYEGNISINSSEGVCIGGGNGGNGGDSEGPHGGLGGFGGGLADDFGRLLYSFSSISFLGGTVEAQSLSSFCFGCGKGGKGGIGFEHVGVDGRDGGPTAITTGEGAEIIAGDDGSSAASSGYSDQKYVRISYPQADNPSSTASVISAGYPWTVIAVAVLAAGGIAAAVIITKKKTAKKADE